VGLIAIVIAIDWAVGAVWERADGDAGDRLVPAASAPVDDGGGAPGPRARDPRVDVAAMADAPWRFEYYDELAELSYDYLPYLYTQASSHRSRYINTRGGVRRSYQAEVDRTAPVPPELWFFGGSAMWGEGQRDDHTIPSEIARIAEEDGLPVRVTNRGERAWVIWQEALLFEQRLAHDPAPALAVFYDGANEVGVQAEHPSTEPTPADHRNWAEHLAGAVTEPGGLGDPGDAGISMRAAVGDLFDSYRSTSALARLVENAGSIVAAAPAGAQDGQGSSASAVEVERRNAEAIYRRGRALARDLGDEAGVRTVFFAQPAFNGTEPYREFVSRLTPGTIDLTATLDDLDEPVYTDEIHTNERGARVVAEAMWPHLRPAVCRWYEAQGAASAACGRR